MDSSAKSSERAKGLKWVIDDGFCERISKSSIVCMLLLAAGAISVMVALVITHWLSINHKASQFT